MKQKILLNWKFLLILALIVPILMSRHSVLVDAQEAKTSNALLGPGPPVFTYQGQLTKDDNLINDNCDFLFDLYQPNGSVKVGNTNTINNVSVIDGRFSVNLSFTAVPALPPNDNLYGHLLEIAVKCSDDTNYITFSDRVSLSAAPVAMYSYSTSALNGHFIRNISPETGQVLTWDGNFWIPTDSNNSEGIGAIFHGRTSFGILKSIFVPLDGESELPSSIEAEVTRLSPNTTCTAQNLVVKRRVAPGAGVSQTINVRDDGSSAISCTIDSFGTTCNSGTATAKIEPGSELAIQITSTVPPDASDILFSFECR